MCPEAVNAMVSVLTEDYGNPSAVHSKGVRAKNVIESSRRSLAKVLSCYPEEIFFSHSGTLANNTAIFGAVESRKKLGTRIVTTAVEHPSVSRCMDALEVKGFEVIRLSPGKDGSFDPADLMKAVNRNTILVSTMFVNNETGAINPVELLSRAVKAANAPALIHVDAIQAFGKLPVKPQKLGVDLLTVSGHKIHAPKGVGALYIKKGLQIKPYVVGGGQENNMFSGTEPVPAIAGFGAAAEALPDIPAKLREVTALRDRMLGGLASLGGVTVNSPENALPYVINLSVPGIPSQVLINFLSERGIYVSAGSACKKGHRSEVLSIMGLPANRIDSAIRVSLSRFTTAEETDAFVRAVADALAGIRKKL